MPQTSFGSGERGWGCIVFVHFIKIALTVKDETERPTKGKPNTIILASYLRDCLTIGLTLKVFLLFRFRALFIVFFTQIRIVGQLL